MEDNHDDIIYDLEALAAEEMAPDGSQTDCACGAAVETPPLHEGEAEENTEISEKSDSSEKSEESEETTDPARKEIERMVGEMGAETLLEIIRDNRNAAIRQIISEVEATQRHDLPSGNSASKECRSIFDLAALA